MARIAIDQPKNRAPNGTVFRGFLRQCRDDDGRCKIAYIVFYKSVERRWSYIQLLNTIPKPLATPRALNAFL